MGAEVSNAGITDHDRITGLLEEEGCHGIYRWSDPPGSRYPWHTHPDNEVRWVTDGEITIGTRDATVTLGPGDRLDVPAGTEHWAESENGVTYVCASR